VRAFGFDGADWVQLTEIEGASEFDSLGFGTKSIALDDSGSRLAFGVLGFDNAQGESIGAAEVFDIMTLLPSSPPSMMPTAAPIAPVLLSGGTITPTVTLSKFDWSLERVGNVSVAFTSATDTEELVMDYSINLRDYAVRILEEDCLTTVPQSVIDYGTSLSITNQTHGDLAVTMNVIQGAVIGSDVWTNMGAGLGLLSVCVRVDLLNTDVGQTSVNFHEQKVRYL